jgi:type III restriction enzyme/adenine-specific DNA-methyltransferase
MIKDIMATNEIAVPNSREITVLKEHFPACFKEDGSFDIERFKEFLSDKILVTNEGHELKFLGKNYGRLLVSLDTTTVVQPDEEHNAKPENSSSGNVYISGDNLDGLKHILKSYSRQVKCIYIDPPYNTGSDGFAYNDKFNFTIEELSEKLSIAEEQAQRILDLTKRGSASHSAWLMFMYPRLQLAKDLLTKDGMLFISIDNNEQSNLKLICDDIFGEINYISTIANINNPKGRSDDKYIATAHEYLLVYRNGEVVLNDFEAEEKVTKRYRETDKNGEKYRSIDLRKTGDEDLRTDREDMFYPFFFNEQSGELKIGSLDEPTPVGFIKILPMKSKTIEGRWRWGKDDESMRHGFENLYAAYMPNKKQWTIFERDYLKDKSGVKPTSVWAFKDVNSERGTEQFVNLGFDKNVFTNPKPLGTIQRCIGLCTSENDIVVDFFSGSATTAHAVMDMNVEGEYNLRYILVQLQESTKEDSETKKAGFDTIDQIGMERIIRAARALKEANPDTPADLGFKHYTLVEPSNDTLDKLEAFTPDENGLIVANTVLETFGKPTVLATWLVRDGYGFTTTPEELDFHGYKGYYIGKHLYLIDKVLPNEAIQAIVAKFETDGSFNPENVVLFGYSFTWTELETLQTNLKRLKDTEKNLRINFDVRY